MISSHPKFILGLKHIIKGVPYLAHRKGIPYPDLVDQAQYDRAWLNDRNEAKGIMEGLQKQWENEIWIPE